MQRFGVTRPPLPFSPRCDHDGPTYGPPVAAASVFFNVQATPEQPAQPILTTIARGWRCGSRQCGSRGCATRSGSRSAVAGIIADTVEKRRRPPNCADPSCARHLRWARQSSRSRYPRPRTASITEVPAPSIALRVCTTASTTLLAMWCSAPHTSRRSSGRVTVRPAGPAGAGRARTQEGSVRSAHHAP